MPSAPAISDSPPALDDVLLVLLELVDEVLVLLVVDVLVEVLLVLDVLVEVLLVLVDDEPGTPVLLDEEVVVVVVEDPPLPASVNVRVIPPHERTPAPSAM